MSFPSRVSLLAGIAPFLFQVFSGHGFSPKDWGVGKEGWEGTGKRKRFAREERKIKKD
jgi:hypothetical protein